MVTMSSGCASVGHAIHELGHAIGMWHEHSRPDRDMYIRVIYENVLETERDNFGILDEIDFSQVPDEGYDVESIMHYGEFAFSKDGDRTIELRRDAPIEDCDNRLPMGQRTTLSYIDKRRANKLYQCSSKSIILGRANYKPLTIFICVTQLSCFWSGKFIVHNNITIHVLDQKI